MRDLMMVNKGSKDMDIIERDGALYLSNGDGPYKNRDSAKRRIRKLATNTSNIVDPKDVTPEQRAFINNGRFPDGTENATPDTLLKGEVTSAPLNMILDMDHVSMFNTYADHPGLPRGHAAFRKHMNIPPMAFNDDPSASGYSRLDTRYRDDKPRNGYRPWHRR